MKNIGIVCDNYKLKKYISELNLLKYEFKITGYETISIIKISVSENNFLNDKNVIHKLRKKIEIHFKQSN